MVIFLCFKNKIKIAYLYPDLLQGYCDRANLDVFKLRSQERNIEVEIDEIRYNVLSVENVKGRGMYIEILAKRVEASNG